MARPKKIKRLTPAERRLFQDPNFAHLATVHADGSPHVAPVWVDITEDDRILINTAEGRAKERNIRREPRVALSVHSQTDPYKMISVAGTVEEVTDENAEPHIDKLAKKYLGMDRYPGRAPGERRLLVRIRPTHVASMGLEQERAAS